MKSDPIVRHSRRVATIELKLPPLTGFTKAVGAVAYLTWNHQIHLLVTFVRTPDNHGPAPYVNEYRDWDLGGTAHREMRELLQERMKEACSSLLRREWPAKDVHLSQCNVTREDDMKFIETTCSGCRCWYCDISSSP